MQRVDPNRIYWQRKDEVRVNSDVEESDDEDGRRSRADVDSQSMHGANVLSPRRPPSYVSDDGVSYVVDAAPRSVAPTTDVPLPPHPSERGRMDAHPAMF